MLNQVVLVGRLTDKPVVIESESGKKYTTIVPEFFNSCYF